MIDIVFITHNRLDYTRKALPRLLEDPDEEFRLTIWDNASTDGTKEYLKAEARDSRIVDIVFSSSNAGQVIPVNHVWSASRAELLGKVDNDCLLSPGWTRILARAHADIPRLGAVACWHFFPDDFDLQRARHKIQTWGGHQILRHPRTCGTGVLIKREAYLRTGPMTGTETGRYWFRLAQQGWINGFYYPPIFQEHMDDPRSEHSHLCDQDSFEEARQVTYNIRNRGIKTLRQRWQWREEVLENLLDEPWEHQAYTGLRGKALRARRALRRIRKRVIRQSPLRDRWIAGSTCRPVESRRRRAERGENRDRPEKKSTSAKLLRR